MSLASDPELVKLTWRSHAGDRHELLGQIDRRRMRFVNENLVKRELLELFRRRAHQPLFAEPYRDAPKAGKTFDIFVALVVIDINAFARAVRNGVTVVSASFTE